MLLVTFEKFLTGNICLLACISTQLRVGSPVYPGIQEQEGAWLITKHSAFKPHVPGHGSTHLLFTQALLRSQSELTTHSGRHPVYGSPKYSGRQVQEPAPPRTLQIAFAPHGEGSQGSRGRSVGGATAIREDNGGERSML